MAIPGVGRYINGSRRWLVIGPVSFQPSEMAKYASIVFLARALSTGKRDIRLMLRTVMPLFVVPGIMFMLILMQPNLSTAGSIIIVAVVMVMLAGARWVHLGMLGVSGMALGTFYALSEDYRRARLMSFTHPFDFLTNEGYQLSQSLIAFGSGGVFGMGLGQGRQKYAYLPYPESDFIFAIVGEDFGLLGCAAVIGLFVALMLAGYRVAVACRDKFGALLAAGITSSITVQAFLNMGVVVGLLPTTGLPLPFFSAGGTSVSITMAAMGILMNISRSAGKLDC
ncbi:MAG: putative peptidoglycan glycosyltransferase FtsW [Clostridiales bacterium]|nr:putative peptidoglycan glycosyltransferase FtsW [Clostridiales bacterium]